MTGRLQQIFPGFTDSILNSYSQVFFSNNKIFAGLLLIVSFFNLNAGISGLIAVVSANYTAYLMGFSHNNIKSGYYGFNSLLVGLGLGIFYQMGVEYLLILLFTSVFTLFVTLMLEGIIGKYGLPYLSISFLMGIWLITLASREFSALSISEKGVFMPNEMYSIGGGFLLSIYNWFSGLNLHDSIIIYFRSLGAIFFQYHLFAGIVIAIGLIIYSRIAFLLSLIGFFSAYFFYEFVGGNIYELSYSYIGFNFILTAIAIGGFFIIPSKNSFLWVLLLTPLTSITITGSMAVLSIFQLSIFSLPFNIIVLMFLYILKFRERYNNKPEVVVYQQFSPEKNLYSHVNNKERFHEFKYCPISLPFWGEWKVTQAHHGNITHKEGWAHAWDFEIADEDGAVYKEGGYNKEDYFCYDKPIICPADGWVEEIVDGVEDNAIGDINLEQNWGNTIVIKHTENLYSKISHIKKDSFVVNKSGMVKKGDVIATCGNSGRSPQPHIHFQLQETPFIGSKTLDYPIGNFILYSGDSFELKSFDRPEIESHVSNIEKNATIREAFHFIPGQFIKFSVTRTDDGLEKDISWEVQADLYNNSCLFCAKTKSKAWFKNDGNSFYFTHFEGNKTSLLFYFYLAAYKVIHGFYSKLKINDNYPIHILNNKNLRFFQDFIAPFKVYMKSEFEIEYIDLKDNLTSSLIVLSSKSVVRHGRKIIREIRFEFEIESDRIKKFIVLDGNKTIEAKEIST